MNLETSQKQSDANCPICAALGAFIEIENAQDPDFDAASEDFPPEARALQVPNEPLAQYYLFGNERLQKCPQCGTYYWYRQWAPGGSEDVLHTYIHESLRRLGFLEAHVELHDALYQSYQRAQEYGGSYVAQYESVRLGVDAEMALLRARHIQIIGEAIDQLEFKYARSEELAESLEIIAPQRDHSDQLEEARERDRRRAAYYAGVLAEYLACAQAGELPAGLLGRLVRLLVDDVPQVRQNVRDALLRLLDAGAGSGTAREIAQEMLHAAAALAPRSVELEELVTACQVTLQSPSSK